ncbi:hypothetical protein HDIA_2823 [Hartmannibacter diazotrophicus]|uniref:Cytochrome c domain-containing protein n=1 Tax=Hartmannibacter diazotrophicus TaxID=1482074 RepID=A0A2C9D7R3_9HYPH|nr:hypothetical protein [Hartmannibacter diazotrophicus]SON56364.1 hypothetical protein HDIA_2823 [Hartmannibacter diazotrophicus]
MTRAMLRAALVAVVVSMAATGDAANDKPGEGQDLTSPVPGNPFAFIPPQCYTRTRTDGEVHNPCYTCHVRSTAPNYVNDGDLQTLYDFPDPALQNRWTNMFVDRRPAISAMSDAAIMEYVRFDNYHDGEGKSELAARLRRPPAGWDINGDGVWSGFVPDIAFNFDSEGYDVTPDGERTGWRAYGYIPLPGSFLPANGSADDVMIRLPAAFREREDGATDWSVYGVNLAIVEALIKRADVPIPPTDEAALGVDLDRDGKLGTATRIAYAFDPRNGITMSYVGKARLDLEAGRLHLAAGLFPEGTEFSHSLRYLDVSKDGIVGPAPRLKELRYARKLGWRTYSSLLDQAMNDLREEHDNPDEPEAFAGDVESGIATGTGWRYQGFIEDAAGSLRPQTYEESLTCAGCHAGTGRPTDTIFSYPRKVDAPANGWFHWGADYRLGDLPDPKRPDGAGRYATYLERNHGSDEFRANREAIDRFFPGGKSDEAAIEALATHIGAMTDPSPRRAIDLNKAYRLIVEEQSFDKGRNATIAPMDDIIWRKVKPGTATGIEQPAD